MYVTHARIVPQERPSMDAILRMPYVRPHVERYAGHVMALGAPRGSGLGGDKAASEPLPLAALGLAHLVVDAAK